MSTCRSCGDPVVWVKMASGKANPLDPDPTPNGNIIVDDKGNGRVQTQYDQPGARYVSHFSTCPFAKQHRVKRR